MTAAAPNDLARALRPFLRRPSAPECGGRVPTPAGAIGTAWCSCCASSRPRRGGPSSSSTWTTSAPSRSSRSFSTWSSTGATALLPATCASPRSTRSSGTAPWSTPHTRTLSTRPRRPVQADRQPPRGVPRARGDRGHPRRRGSRHRRRPPRTTRSSPPCSTPARRSRKSSPWASPTCAWTHSRRSACTARGPKKRVCPLWPQTADLLRALLAERGRELQSDEPVFRNHRGTRLTRFGVRYLLQKYCTRAQAAVPALRTKRLHPHSMRHSTVVHLLRAGVDIVTISQWLGHASVTTTDRYATVDLDMKRQALAKARPTTRATAGPARWPTDAVGAGMARSTLRRRLVMWSGRPSWPGAELSAATPHY